MKIYKNNVETKPPVFSSKSTTHQEVHSNYTFLDQLRSFDSRATRNLSVPEKVLFELFGKGKEAELIFKKIHLAFEEQANNNPNKIAAQHLRESITYFDLNRKAEQLANVLIQNGVKTGDNVGVFISRSISMLIGMIAILKAGAAYVPQDVRISPKSHLKNIIDDAEINIVLSLSIYEKYLPAEKKHKTIFIDKLNQELDSGPSLSKKNTDLIHHSDSDNCFILFTSGTTGKPNGVKVTHKNLCNIVLTSPGNLNIDRQSYVAQILNIAFDMAAWEIWGALCHGATLLIRDKDIQETANLASVIIATPSILATINPRYCSEIKSVAVAGEPCSKPLADKWVQVADFYNCCGPTETTIVNTVKKYNSKFDQLTIGKPTPNNTVYVLDKDLNPCAIGAVGEMWAGGDCVTAGYLNNKQLTDERYRPDPFLGENKMMFRTRDLGRWTLDGELEHLGRTDDQVKIKGFRVELDSISNTLEKNESCEKAVTIKLMEDNLTSFVIPSSANIEELYSTIVSSLPYYCVPANIYTLEEIPLTKRGKVDKRKLHEFAIQSLRKEHTAKEGVACKK